jgi:hypothetical protein
LNRCDFAKQAGISEPTLRRALRSEPINLQSAQRIAAVIGQTEPNAEIAALVLGPVA